MRLQYAKFASLVLPGINASIPIFPFDMHHGSHGDTNVGYHFWPAVELLQIADCGFQVSHYADMDSRRLCLFAVGDGQLSITPDILTDAVDMGLAAWGGKRITEQEALALAKALQPTRSVESKHIDPKTREEVTQTTTYGAFELVNGMLTRTVTVV